MMENQNRTAPDVKAVLGTDARLTEEFLCGHFRDDAGLQSVIDAARYSLFAGGKRIRPALCLETCRAMGGDPARALPFAGALEMVHTYSLIHDDLPCMDDDDLRRGRPTNHKVYGEATAMLAGDGLLTDAFGVAASAGVAPSVAVFAVRELSEAAGTYGMVGGQILDLAGEHTAYPLPTLLRLHALKTGRMIRAAVTMGALAAGVDRNGKAMKALRTYAENIGLVFQIVDDILDRTSNAATLGKNVGVDTEREKTTFLSFYTVEEAAAYADNLTESAVKALSVFPEADIAVLTALARYLAERKN